MKKIAFPFILLLMIVSCKNKTANPKEEFDYLGQQKPNNNPEIFGPDLVSLDGRFELGLTISPDGKTMAFGVADELDKEKTCIYFMNFADGKWSEPDKTLLPENSNTYFPMFGPTNNEFYYAKSTDSQDTDLWKGIYKDKIFTKNQPLDSIFNSPSREAGHGKSFNGTIYFTSNRDDENSCCGDIFYSIPNREGIYQFANKIDEVNSNADEESLYLSPNEDYMIIQAWLSDYQSKHDLYITYKTKNSRWSSPQRLNERINTPEIEQRPFVSPDSDYLFFSRMKITRENEKEIYDSDIYWVSTKAIFKPYVYNSNFDYDLQYEEEFLIALPPDLFKDVDGTKLIYQTTLDEDPNLPPWMVFNQETMEISGRWSTKEEVNLTITAIDEFGNEGSIDFKLGI